MRYDKGDSIPFSIYYTNSKGVPQKKQSIELTLINLDSDNYIYYQESMNETLDGLYKFIWQNPQTKGNYLAIIEQNINRNKRKLMASYDFKIVENLEKIIESIDESDGRAF